LIFVLAMLGAVMALAGRAEPRGRTLPAVLAGAALLATVVAALHTKPELVERARAAFEDGT
jgi:hypothetical protein